MQKNKNWHERFRNMKTGMGYSNDTIAKITGNTGDSIKSSTRPSLTLPRWTKLAIVIYETLSEKIKEEESPSKKK